MMSSCVRKVMGSMASPPTIDDTAIRGRLAPATRSTAPPMMPHRAPREMIRLTGIFFISQGKASIDGRMTSGITAMAPMSATSPTM